MHINIIVNPFCWTSISDTSRIKKGPESEREDYIHIPKQEMENKIQNNL